MIDVQIPQSMILTIDHSQPIKEKGHYLYFGERRIREATAYGVVILTSEVLNFGYAVLR